MRGLVPQKSSSCVTALGEASFSILLRRCGLLGQGNTHMTVGDIHKYHNADDPLGSSHQDLANPALSWPKCGVTDEGQGDLEKKLPLAARVVKLAQDLGNI